jgi:hypothetical protein
MMQIGEERSVLLTRYRASVEVALAKADFVNTVELSTLQALAIFLVSLSYGRGPFSPNYLPPHFISRDITDH